MAIHETKTCPRCNSAFVCKAGDIGNCDCGTISLNFEERAFIEDRYQDCLCINCLSELKNRYIFFKEKFLQHGK